MSTNSASATVTLSARIPGPAQLGDLLDQLAGELRRIEIPGLPTAQLGRLSAGFKIALPDTSSWSDIVVPDAAALLRDFPNPADLAGPLRAPIERVRSFLATDFSGELARLQGALGAIEPPAPGNPRAFFADLFAPLTAIADLLKDSELIRLLVALGESLGVGEIGRLPEEIVAFFARLKTLLQERAGNTLLAVGSVSAAGTLVARLERQAETLVRDALRTVEDAVRQIDLGPIRGVFDQGLAQVEGRLSELDAIFSAVRGEIEDALNQVKAALDGARNFILDPNDGLKKKIEEIFKALFDLLDQLNIKGAVDQINQTLQPITVELGRVEFAPVIDATVSVIDTIVDVLGTVAPLLVTDDLKRKLGEATQFLRQIDFDEIARTLNDAFDEILSAVDEEALGRFKEEYDKAVAAINQLDPAPALEALQAEVFDPLIAELEKFDPAELLQPVQEAFDAARGALDGFDPAATLAFITEFFDDLMAKVGELSPARLLAPVEQVLAELRQTIISTLRIDDLLRLLDQAVLPLRTLIEGVDVGRLFDALGPGFAELKQAVAEFDPAELTAPLAAALRSLFAATGLDIERDGVAGLLAAVGTASGGLGTRLTALPRPLEEKAAELGRLDVRGALQTLRARHEELRAALAVHAAAGPLHLELAAGVGALDPMPVLAPVSGRVGRVQSAFTAQATALGELARGLGQPFATADAAAQALGRLLSPLELLKEMLREPVRRLTPDRADAGFKELLLALLDAIDPTQWRPELQEITAALRSKLQSLLGDVLINPLRETLLSLKRTVELLDISALREAIEGVFRQVEATLRQFDPRPIIEAMDATYRRVLGLFDKLNPAQFIVEIGRLYREDVIGVLRAISPRDLLLPSLRELFAKIGELLVAFDIEGIFRPVLDRLRGLQEQLVVGLERAGASFDRMLNTLDSAVGGQVSVSVSVSTS